MGAGEGGAGGATAAPLQRPCSCNCSSGWPASTGDSQCCCRDATVRATGVSSALLPPLESVVVCGGGRGDQTAAAAVWHSSHCQGERAVDAAVAAAAAAHTHNQGAAGAAAAVTNGGPLLPRLTTLRSLAPGSLVAAAAGCSAAADDLARHQQQRQQPHERVWGGADHESFRPAAASALASRPLVSLPLIPPDTVHGPPPAGCQCAGPHQPCTSH